MHDLKYWLPPGAIDIVRVRRAQRDALKLRHILAQNESLRATGAGEVFIIGNGPSLGNFDLSLIGNGPVITMNHFERHPNKLQLNIVAHCVGEPYGAPSWEDPTPMLEVPARIFLFNTSAIPYFRSKTKHKIHYYHAGIPITYPMYRKIDLTKAALSYQSTSQMAISLAIYMGYKKVNLVGFDHDWLVTRGASTHFYQEDDLPQADLSAFSYLEMIEISRTLFAGYLRLRELGRFHGCRIYNLSQPTYLDIFPRSDGVVQ